MNIREALINNSKNRRGFRSGRKVCRTGAVGDTAEVLEPQLSSQPALVAAFQLCSTDSHGLHRQ